MASEIVDDHTSNLLDYDTMLEAAEQRETSRILSTYFKHCDVRITTESIYLEDILELQKVYSAPKRDLPTLINDLKTERGKEALKARLS